MEEMLTTRLKQTDKQTKRRKTKAHWENKRRVTDCSLHRNTILSTLTSHCQEHTWHYVHFLLLKYVLMFILTVNRKNILQVVGSFPTLWFQRYGKAG